MITSFEVGAVFKIINEASPALLRILRQVRELRAEIDKAKESLATIGRMPGTGLAIAEAGDLAKAWGDVAKNAGAARLAIANASTSSARATAAAAVAGGTGGGGGGGRHQPGFLRRGGGAHITGPGVSIPGGGHMRFGGGAMAAAGLLGYGAYEAAEIEKAVWWLNYHAGRENDPTNQAQLRKTLQDSMALTGFSPADTYEAALDEMRMFKGTPGGGVDVLPEMLKAASIESLAKGEGLKDSMKAFIGLAHMTKEYSPEEIKKLAPVFAFLSTANPARLSSIERSAGYAVPLLQSSLGIDPTDSLLLGTALTRAGITNTKSGTWLREMAVRAMPGTAIFESEKKAEHHDELLKKLGLLDDKGKATWMTDGHADVIKMLDIAGPRLAALPMEERVKAERLLFGAQGSGAVAVLGDKAVHEQIGALRQEMNSDEFRNKYKNFFSMYNGEVTAQQMRTSIAEFNNTMMDLGKTTLPAVNHVLKDLKGILDAIRGVPHPPKASDEKWGVGATAIEGAGLGFAVGSAFPGVGSVAGAGLGAIAGGGAAAAHDFFVDQVSKSTAATAESMKTIADALRILPGGPGGVFPGGTSRIPQVSLSINLDGRTLAQAVTQQQEDAGTFPTGGGSGNGAELYTSQGNR
jgi:TP901 family phage tail tape measure protein